MDTPVAARKIPAFKGDNLSGKRPAILGVDELRRTDAYWRAANYLSVGQIYLYDNPLLREPLTMAHIKPLVVGHWGTTPGQNFIYVHLNRVIKKHDLNMLYISGPGHGGPAVVGNVYLEGTYSEVYPNISRDEAGLKKLFTQFSFPGGISSHVAPTCQFWCVLGARWIALAAVEGQHLSLGPASLSILGHRPGYPGVRVIALWNAVPASLLGRHKPADPEFASGAAVAVGKAPC